VLAHDDSSNGESWAGARFPSELRSFGRVGGYACMTNRRWRNSGLPKRDRQKRSHSADRKKGEPSPGRGNKQTRCNSLFRADSERDRFRPRIFLVPSERTATAPLMLAMWSSRGLWGGGTSPRPIPSLQWPNSKAQDRVGYRGRGGPREQDGSSLSQRVRLLRLISRSGPSARYRRISWFTRPVLACAK
jgi:hypothetical protein